MTTKSPKKHDEDRERAKRVIVEIIRINGGSFNLKTSLYKAFYHAHIRYAKTASGYLSTWPIVKMPRGPGIHHADELLSELVADGILQVEDNGGFDGFSFALTKLAKNLPELRPEEIKAIRFGVKRVEGKTAAQVSEESHHDSRSWNRASSGDELNIYADIPDDKTHKERTKFFRNIDRSIAKHF